VSLISLKTAIISNNSQFVYITDYSSDVASLHQKWLPIAPLLSYSLFQSLLRVQNLGSPTKIQLKVFPCLLQAGEDIVAQISNPLESVISYLLPAIQICTSSPAPPNGGISILVVTASAQSNKLHTHIRYANRSIHLWLSGQFFVSLPLL